MIIGKGYEDGFLTVEETRALMAEALDAQPLDDKRVLVIIPDSTRTAPLPLFFRLFHELLRGDQPRVQALDYVVALGTHQPMSEQALLALVGITAEEYQQKYADVSIYNHRWDLPGTLVSIGAISEGHIFRITEGLMSQGVEITINRMIFDYDVLIICGPTFPHEVIGFSGGNKYFFPGISGPEIINFTHWLGAVITSYEVIGTSYTPVRAIVDAAASLIDRPKLCFSMVVKATAPKGEELAGLFIGTPEEAYEAAAELSSRLHIVWVDRPFQRVLSVMPTMYDDLWTAAKGMYKMEPAIADGGEVIIYAPHIDEISYTHGHIIDEVGYHVRDYFLKQWDRFKHYPWGVLAHSTHLRGMGTYDPELGIERPRIQVTLATAIPRERCERVNLGYRDPDTINLEDWKAGEQGGELSVANTLLVPKAGEMLYRVRPDWTHPGK